MDTALGIRIRNIINLARKQDWKQKSFSSIKAHICVELSALVYEDVQEYELKKASRIHLFASDTYRAIIKSGQSRSMLASLNDADAEARFFVVRGRYAVVFGTVIDEVVILAVRGTVFRKLWDWKANVDSTKYNVGRPYGHPFGSNGFDDQFFHKGFFESIVPQFESIADAISKLVTSEDGPTIVWAGHSLGGAMAAVANAIYEPLIRRRTQDELTSAGAYTFGMPRYCGLGAACYFEGPHHIYKARDIVPTVPLRRMGFVDSSQEYQLTDSGEIELTERTDAFGLAGHVPKLLASISAHSIEGYATSLARAVKLPRP